MPYLIALNDGRIPKARIDVVGRSVILHSRGGSTGGRPARNTGYSEALIAICQRAQITGALERVLIDSAVARRIPETDRVLLTRDEISLLGGEDLARAVRTRVRRFGQARGTKGGNATKQVRFDLDLSQQAIIDSLSLAEGELDGAEAASSPTAARLSADQLNRVSPLHIRHAVDRLLAGEDAANFSPSRDYDVVVPGGERLAPKKVFALALEQALGIEAFPAHFSAGWGHPCFDLIQEAGFVIIDKRAPADTPATSTQPTPPDPDEQGWAEGNPRFAEHLRTERRRSRKAVAAKRAAVRASNEGRLVCENPRCTADWYAVFPLAIAEAVFEVHHKVMVSAMRNDHRTRLSDLLCLCAGCHRAEHRRLALEVK